MADQTIVRIPREVAVDDRRSKDSSRVHACACPSQSRQLTDEERETDADRSEESSDQNSKHTSVSLKKKNCWRATRGAPTTEGKKKTEKRAHPLCFSARSMSTVNTRIAVVNISMAKPVPDPRPFAVVHTSEKDESVRPLATPAAAIPPII